MKQFEVILEFSEDSVTEEDSEEVEETRKDQRRSLRRRR